MSQKNDFVDPNQIQVIIPYSSLEKVFKMAQELEEIKKQNARIEEQYAAIRGMFSECLEKISEIQNFVKD
jgi:hypothetical protein